jgi:hypothetical protein
VEAHVRGAGEGWATACWTSRGGCRRPRHRRVGGACAAGGRRQGRRLSGVPRLPDLSGLSRLPRLPGLPGLPGLPDLPVPPGAREAAEAAETSQAAEAAQGQGPARHRRAGGRARAVQARTRDGRLPRGGERLRRPGHVRRHASPELRGPTGALLLAPRAGDAAYPAANRTRSPGADRDRHPRAHRNPSATHGAQPGACTATARRAAPPGRSAARPRVHGPAGGRPAFSGVVLGGDGRRARVGHQ